VDATPATSLVTLRWIREHLVTLIEDQREGINEKMADINMYTTILNRLKGGTGEQS
jgi:hypothetical protein